MTDRWQGRLASGETVIIDPVLRRLDGRRVAGRATLDGDLRFAKAFTGSKAGRDVQREIAGLAALREAGLQVPEIVETARLTDGGELLLVEWIDGVSPARVDHELAEQLLTDLAVAHNAGVLVEDPHLDNVFIADDSARRGIVWLDGGDVSRSARPISQKRGLRRACRLLAEFSPMNDQALLAALRAYETTRGFSGLSEAAARRRLAAARRARIQLIVAKTTRQCTAYSVRKNAAGFSAWIDDSGLPLHSLLASAPFFDELLANATQLKAGNSAEVSRVDWQGMALVVKQTRAKSLARLVRRIVKGSRARRSWSYGHVLGYFAIPTAQPMLVHERRIGPLVPHATLLCEALSGPTLAQTDCQSASNVGAAARLIVAIHQLGLRHGDTKASNFVVTPTGVFVIDLDAMAPGSRAERQRDRDRFLANFSCDSEPLAAARAVFDRDPL
ncbi:MAG: hypothetical protein NXH85_08865 [Pseudomonadaceae bacterium]|nr:hypothetical protein [Pseudomonadaceae bacterium]